MSVYITTRKPRWTRHRHHRTLAGVQSQPLEMRGPRAAVQIVTDVPLEYRSLDADVEMPAVPHPAEAAASMSKTTKVLAALGAVGLIYYLGKRR